MLIADNTYSDGNNRYNQGRATSLYKTAKGNFFLLHETCWQGERDTITPISQNDAEVEFEELHDHSVEFAEAFGRQPEEA